MFLSHAATDVPIAQVIHDEIKRIFANGVDIFASSVPGIVEPGSDWLAAIRLKLERAQVVIVVITPVSISRPWIWFEVGASWSKMDQGEGRILPVCVSEIDKGGLPEPLNRLHALSLGDASDTRLLFQTLCDHFDFGSMEGFDYESIRARLPRYPDLPVADSDVESGTLDGGPYEDHHADLADLIEDNRRWFRDRDARLKAEKADATSDLNSKGLFHSGAWIQVMAIKQQDALRDYRDEMSLKRRRYRKLREAAGNASFPRFALTEDQLATLSSWRADIEPAHMSMEPQPIDDPTSEAEEPDLRRFEREGDPPVTS